jgi:hypothetical protein
MSGGWQSFCEDIGNHFSGTAILKADYTILDQLADEMEFDVNMFHTTQGFLVRGEGDGSLVILEDGSRFVVYYVDFFEEMTRP